MASKESKRDSKREREDRTEEKDSRRERTDERKSKHNGSSRKDEGERSNGKADTKANPKTGEKSAKKVKEDRPKDTKAKEAKPSETKVAKDAKQETSKRRFKEAAAPETDAKPKAVKASKSEPEKKKARTSEKERPAEREKPAAKSAKPAKAERSEKLETKGRSEKPAREEKVAKPDDADKVAKITLKPSPSPSPSPEKVEKATDSAEKAEPRSRRSAGACAAEALDDAASSGSSSSGTASSRRERQKDRGKDRGKSSFSATLVAPPAPFPPGAVGLMQPPQPADVTFGPAAETSLVPLAEKVQGLLDNQQSIAQEMARMKQVMGGVAKEPAKVVVDPGRGEGNDATLKMPAKLTENLLHPDNEAQLLVRTGLQAAMLNEEGHVVLRADSPKSLQKAMGQLRRVAYHCQWGCSKEKVAALLQEKPARKVHTMVVRLAATSSRLQSFELRLNLKTPKLRIGSDRASCQMVVDLAGVSRKHCTITFEPEKGAVYVQDLSTNGTYFNGKKLPRPPYKNPQDARVRVFHGDELLFKVREKDAEELGYMINMMELS